ncbi:MAG: HAD-IC family P-type ATPase, partial [Kiloniellales bacterium]
EKVDTLVIDKTGTLTEGKPRLDRVIAAPCFEEARVLGVAASLEKGSEHPLAAAILEGAREHGLALASVADFESRTGKGVIGRIQGARAVLGNRTLIEELGLDSAALQVLEGLETRAEVLRQAGATVVYLAIEDKIAGVIGVSDPIKASSPEAIELLRAEGLEIVMLTGDNLSTARAVAGRLGLERIEAEVLPAQKSAVIERLQGEGRIVAMAGDGINDAPALARAQVGIAMGTGTDVAMESADITLVKGDLRGIVRARRLSRATMGNIRQNLVFAFLYNALGVPVAAGVLYPIFGLLLSPMLAAAAMSLSSVSVIGNALRLRRLSL